MALLQHPPQHSMEMIDGGLLGRVAAGLVISRVESSLDCFTDREVFLHVVRAEFHVLVNDLLRLARLEEEVSHLPNALDAIGYDPRCRKVVRRKREKEIRERKDEVKTSRLFPF